jgi:hypothetical protein
MEKEDRQVNQVSKVPQGFLDLQVSRDSREDVVSQVCRARMDNREGLSPKRNFEIYVLVFLEIKWLS